MIRTVVVVAEEEASRTHRLTTVESMDLHMDIVVVVAVVDRDRRVSGKVPGMDTRTGKDCMVASWGSVARIAGRFLDRNTSDQVERAKEVHCPAAEAAAELQFQAATDSQ